MDGPDPDLLRDAATAVARYRGVELTPITDVKAGYGQIDQDKRAAWRRNENVRAVTEADLDAQMTRVAAVLNWAFSTTQDPTPTSHRISNEHAGTRRHSATPPSTARTGPSALTCTNASDAAHLGTA